MGRNTIIKKESIYKGEHDLGTGAFKIEILFTMSDDLVISGKKIDGPENYVIEIEKSQVAGLLREFSNDLPLMCSYLRL